MEERDYDCRLLRSGALEYRDRAGRYRLTWGCCASDWHEFWERLELVHSRLTQLPGVWPIEQAYLNDDTLRHHCDRLLRLNAIAPQSLSPAQVRLLLFATDAQTPAPLVQLNQLPETQHPPLPNSKPITNRAQLLAVITAACGGNVRDALEVARSTPARELLALLDERSWQLATPDERDRAVVLAEQVKSLCAQRGEVTSG